MYNFGKDINIIYQFNINYFIIDVKLHKKYSIQISRTALLNVYEILC